MKVLVIGGGGREHAIVWKLKQSPRVREIFCSPGNGGIGDLARIVPACAEGDWGSYADFVKQNKVDLTVVGPEAPLAGGLVDRFEKEGLRAFGPKRDCAQLEASKVFSKEFMSRHGIPSARYRAFQEASAALEHLRKDFPASGCVVKADGLAAGKGVSVCSTRAEAEAAVDAMMAKKIFGEAGARVVIEERLSGEELSLMAFCDGKTVKPLAPARDHKRVFDSDEGPNTGGMGAFAPAPVAPETWRRIQDEVVQPFLKGLQKDGLDYRGIIYFGLMLTPAGPQVLEFNVRFGDPETQVLLPLLDSDLFDLFSATAEGRLANVPLQVAPACCVTVVCASGGYPGKFTSHREISGLENLPSSDDAMVFHAGTVRESGKYYTHGGRVLNATAKGRTFQEAKERCYGLISKIRFQDMHYRTDIGRSVLQSATAR